ncbi:hypothetical protein [Rhodanobacter sp. A1T4]|uniref:hypothetical protein n=1 Tax=Rhodanobacter sp. A1T4 TaxID=2723087 RepID=UPI0016216C46|nr:hypothetical protein [Rhodanobacter sp. A1T4]MBB6245023.1 hypothetical protein [Rhodanobacter sp. A1T4]
MTLHDHWLLMAGIAVLYLYDSALLLFHNEIVLETRRTGYLVSGGSVMEFRGRHLFLPNPLCPHRALVRLSWAADEPMTSGALRTRGRRVRLALAVIAPWTCALLGLFFVALPCALWVGTDVLLLGWLILTYLTIAAMLWQVWRARKALSLSGKAVVALAFDALLCAPFAINMVRKINLRQELPSLRSVALSRLSPAENVVLSGILRQRIEASLGFLEPGTEASNALLAYLKRFEDGMS